MINQELVAEITRKLLERPHVSIYYPQVKGLEYEYVEKIINQEILNLVEELIQQDHSDGETVVDITGSYLVRLNKKNILSIRFEIYSYQQWAAHGLTIVKSLTFELSSGRIYQLGDLFRSDSEYLLFISDEINKQIIEKDIPLITDFRRIHDQQDYYLSDHFLIIYFQLYEYTPYVYGIPQFYIPLSSLKDFVRKNSPIDRLLKNG